MAAHSFNYLRKWRCLWTRNSFIIVNLWFALIAFYCAVLLPENAWGRTEWLQTNTKQANRFSLTAHVYPERALHAIWFVFSCRFCAPSKGQAISSLHLRCSCLVLCRSERVKKTGFRRYVLISDPVLILKSLCSNLRKRQWLTDKCSYWPVTHVWVH